MAEDPALGLESERMLYRHATSTTGGSTSLPEGRQEQDHLEALATVIYSEPRLGMGVSFTQLSAERKSILEKWLADVVQNGRH